MRLMWVVLIVGALFWVTSASPAFGSSNVIQATKTRGIRSIGDLRINGGYQITLFDAVEAFGRPGLIRRPDPYGCDVYFGRGLRLNFSSFGGENRCYYRYLQAGLIRSRYWKVRVGKRLYRVGMPKRRIPKRAKKRKSWGYQLASTSHYGGTVFALVGGKGRIRAFRLFIGHAGD